MAVSSEDNPPALPGADVEHRHIFKYHLELFGILDNTVEFPDSITIKDEDHALQLHNCLKEDGLDGELTLWYWSSRDGSSDSNCHSKCVDQGCTLNVIEAINSFVGGGYSNTP